jgi:alpha-beta hydrolase superfamily lysophospholipase
MRYCWLALAPVLLVLAVGAYLSEIALHPPRRAGGPASAPVVTLRTADGVRLVATWEPSSPATGRCAILLHGVQDSRASMAGLAAGLRDYGYSTLTPDSRAHGESGGMATFGVRERGDVLAWIAWMKRSGCSSVVGLGESMGAAILLQAADEPGALRAVVAECPYEAFIRIADDRVTREAPVWPFLRRPLAWVVVRAGFLYTRVRYGINLYDAAPIHTVGRIQIPVLLIHGDADHNIDPSQSRDLLSAQPRAQLWIVPGATHTNASTTSPEKFSNRVTAFFAAAP